MSYDDEWLQQTLANREKSIRESIRPATVEELKELGKERFPVASDPWCERYNAFLSEHGRDDFYLAKTHEGAEIVYSHTAGRAIWFLPGKGMGLVQAKGLALLSGIVASLRT